MQGFLAFRSSIASQGKFFAPAGDARISIVDIRDIVAVAAIALTGSGHEGKIYERAGPEALTHSDMASQLSDALGKQVAFIDISECARRSLLTAFRSGRPRVQRSPRRHGSAVAYFPHIRAGL